ncbi:GP46-like surface antigen, putative [Bodo saltans]|uniref:GP46-like surface antigen, putative n=1 Tax=Bodo saltans TaxID=75058 RepID=A0A0S4J2K2_BODSA|nr:GP46-like surface antigen, putative [Bodo saltans]|eukprot:CUG57255.1 GP46-like surface antigen, putative [Bodo saltans]
MGSTLPLLYGPFLTLMLSFNALEGTLPVAWSNFSKIFWLSVSHNDVFGTLPASWLQQKTLSTLELNDNLLSGSIPLGDNTSTVLMLLNVSNNCFIGTLNRTVRTTLTVDVCNTHVHEGSALSTCASRLSQRWPQECNSQSQSLSLQVSRSRSTQPTSTFVLGGPSATQRPSSSGELKASISATIMFLHDPSSPLPSLATAASSPIAATAVISAVSGVDSGSAQALLTILDSACSCTSPTRSLPRQRQGVQYQEVEQRSSVPRAASLALSPLVLIGDSVGPFEVVIGNVALCIGMLFVQCTVVVVHHLRCTDDDESQVAEKNGVSVNHKPLSHDRVLNVHHIACSPSGALFRFPSATLRLTAFLVAGIVWGVAQLLSSPDFFTDNGAEEGNLDDLFEDAQGFDTITVLLGTCIGIVFLVCLGAILYVVVLHSWILDGAQGLQFEPFARVRGNTNPFSPPFPSRVASVLCSREGQWAPIPRRAAFGSPIATPFMPWCLKWAWAIGPTTSLIAVALSTAAPPSRHRTRACDGIQAVLICLYIVTAAVFAKLLPHRSIMRSLLAAFSNTLNGAVVVLSLLCRYELVGRDSPFIVASVGGYMSLCGSVLMFVVDRLEQRVLQGQQGEQAASSANSRRQSQHQHSRIDIRAYSAEQHDDVLRLQQLAALQRLIERHVKGLSQVTLVTHVTDSKDAVSAQSLSRVEE